MTVEGVDAVPLVATGESVQAERLPVLVGRTDLPAASAPRSRLLAGITTVTAVVSSVRVRRKPIGMICDSMEGRMRVESRVVAGNYLKIMLNCQ